MARKVEILLRNENNTRILCIDVENKKKILDYLTQDERHKKKFRVFCDLFLGKLRIHDLYGKEAIDSKTKGVTAIKFFKRNENDRIYCKEIELKDTKLVIVMSELLTKKKNKKLKQREKNIIKKVGSYTYEIEI